MQNHHQQSILSTTTTPQQQQQHQEPLPFATLTGRQSEEADRILSRQQQVAATKKSNGLKQGFAQLGARLSRKNNGSTNNNQTSGSTSSSSSSTAGNRDRSETV
ncbi:hypothetical protein MUCCIDRAFT_157065 [Mucor lusitanicus CBS 277.49]|uniref:Uncharacterized protein n=3 Tax=Mucor circinelloides f. lusitanicus TaxID=29924 RepID=A0A162QB97_MUCCL|nr:hypothetical protein MUCCIDRAFT_157065 [Mucor lusitanicus CBS 277.49]